MIVANLLAVAADRALRAERRRQELGPPRRRSRGGCGAAGRRRRRVRRRGRDDPRARQTPSARREARSDAWRRGPRRRRASTSSSTSSRSTSSTTTTEAPARAELLPSCSPARPARATSCSRSARTRSRSSTRSRRGSRTCSRTRCASTSSTARRRGQRSSARSTRYNELAERGASTIEPALVDAVLDEVAAGRVELGALRPRRPAERHEAGSRRRTSSSSCERLWDDERDAGRGSCGSRRSSGSAAPSDRPRPTSSARWPRSPATSRTSRRAMFNHLVTPSGTKIAHGVERPRRLRGASTRPSSRPCSRRSRASAILRPVATTATAAPLRDLPRRPRRAGARRWRGRHEEQRVAAQRRGARRRQRPGVRARGGRARRARPRRRRGRVRAGTAKRRQPQARARTRSALQRGSALALLFTSTR